MNQQKLVRNIHRDFGYFYVGLIISFAFSGILMNHRENWHPEKYTTSIQNIKVKLVPENKINDKYAEQLGKKLGIDDKIRRQAIKKGALKISFENHDVEIDLKTGAGEIITFNKTPIINQAMKLHKSTSNWWIYYSDIFGISLILIAITGTLMVKHGKNTFRNRGWKLAVIGILFPLLVLFIIS